MDTYENHYKIDIIRLDVVVHGWACIIYALSFETMRFCLLYKNQYSYFKLTSKLFEQHKWNIHLFEREFWQNQKYQRKYQLIGPDNRKRSFWMVPFTDKVSKWYGKREIANKKGL